LYAVGGDVGGGSQVVEADDERRRAELQLTTSGEESGESMLRDKGEANRARSSKEERNEERN
jgi:hypothetical protein